VVAWQPWSFDFRPITLRPIFSNSLPFSTSIFYLIVKEKEVGSLAILAAWCLRPSPLRPIFSNSLPFSTSNRQFPMILLFICQHSFSISIMIIPQMKFF